MIDLSRYVGKDVLLCEEKREFITLQTVLNYAEDGSLCITQQTCIDGIVIAEGNILLQNEHVRALQSCLNDTPVAYDMADDIDTTITA